ncbi:uncharacterized protein LOC128327889 isoform X6 [Hemicordylus capensis]|uniref:uncharacterized protein LOC128327889 isoform X6 n=1 Tax=Hemicordylus capensis TaxID=884348 RepID=UPI002303A282|nr:uncharacterized protein LOC128327889 isoform X6 [Hemicordylus capensis]
MSASEFLTVASRLSGGGFRKGRGGTTKGPQKDHSSEQVKSFMDTSRAFLHWAPSASRRERLKAITHLFQRRSTKVTSAAPDPARIRKDPPVIQRRKNTVQ